MKTKYFYPNSIPMFSYFCTNIDGGEGGECMLLLAIAITIKNSSY